MVAAPGIAAQKREEARNEQTEGGAEGDGNVPPEPIDRPHKVAVRRTRHVVLPPAHVQPSSVGDDCICAWIQRELGA